LTAVEQKRDFYELQFSTLKEQHQMLKIWQPNLAIYPHQMCYDEQDVQSNLQYMKDVDCALCVLPLPLNDIIVTHCRHVYHLWCLMSHFRVSNSCANPNCAAVMSHDWLKSIGVTELDPHNFEEEVLGEYKQIRSRCITHRQHMAMLNFSKSGMQYQLLLFWYCYGVLFALFLNAMQ
jgi:hypothetical protein